MSDKTRHIKMSLVLSCHLGCGMEWAEDDTGLVLDFFFFFFPANKNKSVPACFRRPETCSQCCKHGPRKRRGEASLKNRVFFDDLPLLTMEISWCTMAFSLCWAASARHMLLSEMQHVQMAVLRTCVVGCIWPLSTALGVTSFMWSI